jgi:hypothetical protein
MADMPKSTLGDRMGGGYEPPILAEPQGGTVPDGSEQVTGGAAPSPTDPAAKPAAKPMG